MSENIIKVAVVGTVGIPARYGGFESLVENLTINAEDSTDYTVFCSSKSYDEKLDVYNNAKLVYLPLSANGVGSIFYDTYSLIKCLFSKPDVVLILGVSGCCFLPLFKLFSKAKVVTNIDGLEWRRDKWGKWTRHFLKISEALAVKFSDTIVTDNKAIEEYVLNEYSANAITIAYGGDHAIRDINVDDISNEYVLGLCRIEPENNVAIILKAFSVLGKQLIFVGNWNASEFGRKLREKYHKYDNITLLDPIYDLDELYRLRRKCSIYIHGHSAGGTNPSLVEMMHFGVPILAFDCNFNRNSTEDQAHYFKSSDDLVDLFQNKVIDTLSDNGKAMKRIAEHRYRWSKITELYENVYRN